MMDEYGWTGEGNGKERERRRRKRRKRGQGGKEAKRGMQSNENYIIINIIMKTISMNNS